MKISKLFGHIKFLEGEFFHQQRPTHNMRWLTFDLRDAADELVRRAAKQVPLLLLGEGNGGDGDQGEEEEGEEGHHCCLHSGELFSLPLTRRVWVWLNHVGEGLLKEERYSLGWQLVSRHKDSYLPWVISYLGILKSAQCRDPAANIE